MGAMRKVSDPYRVLGVSRGADAVQIKAAHRRLAKRHHPDAAGGDEARFVAVQEAYLLLSDPLRRREWDRRHAPGPVDARDRGTRASARAASARWTREDAGAYRRTRSSRPAAGAGRRDEAGPATTPGATGSGRDPGSRRATWSAEGVPWWEDFTPKSRPAASRRQAGDRVRPPTAGETRITGDMDAFSRSSGAAWSSAARRHFRRDEATLPSRGAFRYRGTQVVTGAEARKLAEEEAAEQDAAAAALFRKAQPTMAKRPPRRAFDHDEPPTRAEPAPVDPPAAPVPTASMPATSPIPSTAPVQQVAHVDSATPVAAPAHRLAPVAATPSATTRTSEPRSPGASGSAAGPGPIVVGAAVATVIAAVPVVLGVSAGTIDPTAPPALATLFVGALVGGVSGWLIARGRGHAAR